MVSKFALLSSLLFTSAVLASSFSRHWARRPENHQSQPINRIESLAGNVSKLAYLNNWAGAVWSEGAGTFTSVQGSFIVPNASLGSGGGGSESGAGIWVGIDGHTCTSAIFQTGINVKVSNDGHATYTLWYEWFPSPLQSFDKPITISAGDVIIAGVMTSSATSGTAVIENWTTGKVATQPVSSSKPLCQQDAEWIVEDFSSGGGPIPFANFGSLTISNAAASDASGKQYTPADASIYQMARNGQLLASASANENTVTIQYVSS